MDILNSPFFSNLPNWLSMATATFVSFFPLIDPLGSMPIFSGLTQQFPPNLIVRIARKSCIIALSLTIFFAFTGDFIFDLFGLTKDALKVVGGIIFFLMGYDMLKAKISVFRIKEGSNAENNNTADTADDIAISPIAMPLLFGPAVLTQSVLIMGEAGNLLSYKIGFVVGLTCLFLFTMVCFIFSGMLTKLIGKNGNRLILRVMGLFMMILAVDTFFEGLTPIVRTMLGS